MVDVITLLLHIRVSLHVQYHRLISRSVHLNMEDAAVFVSVSLFTWRSFTS